MERKERIGKVALHIRHQKPVNTEDAHQRGVIISNATDKQGGQETRRETYLGSYR